MTLTTESSPVVGAHPSTDSELSPVIGALAAQAGITNVPEIVEQIRGYTQRRVSRDVAVGIARHLLTKARGGARVPQLYVLSTIEQSPLEVQQYIDEGGLAS